MQNIISDFESFIEYHGKNYSEFYVGIASNPIDRLENGHNVIGSTPFFYSVEPLHTDMVRAIEKYFLDKGTQGGSGGGDNDTQYVYIYLVTSDTRE